MAYQHKRLKELNELEIDKLMFSCSSFYYSYSKSKKFKKQVDYFINNYFNPKYENEIWLIVTSCLRTMRQGNINTKFSLGRTNITKANLQGMKLNYDRLRLALTTLEEEGYLTLFIGDRHDGKLVDRRTSIISFSDKMLCMFSEAVVKSSFKLLDDSELVVVRSSKTKEPIVDKQFNGIKLDRKEVKAYNTLMENFTVTIFGVKCGIVCRKIYLDNMFSSGRYYLGNFQTNKSKYRKFIEISGAKTIERDISAIHPSILACREGIIISDDHRVYECYDGLRGDPKELRSIFKLAVMCLLFSKDNEEANGSLRKHIIDGIKNKDIKTIKPSRKLVDDIFDRLLDHNPVIDKYKFSTDLWRDLQYTDSQICRYVMNKFVSLRKPILLYHDGFVVVKEDDDLLIKTIEEAWFHVLGTNNNLRIK